MRVDSIDLIGDFKIQGLTGSSSQAIGMSGGSTSFIDVVASGGSSEGLSQKSGYNYIIVEATGDALANGTTLLTAYTEAVTLLGQIGTPAADNRVSILLTPGDYDLVSTPLSVSNSFIDIVGISQNPLDTIVRASGTFSTIGFGTPGLDFGLYNIDLRSGGIDQQVAFYDGGSGSAYLRMKNVVLSGNGFYTDVPFYSFYDLDGEFEDITVLDGCNFAIASNTVTGTYKNIKIGDVLNAFFTPSTLTGTYKNIKISNLTGASFYGTSVSGIFEDIRINGGGSIFRGSLSGYYKNIIISDSSASVFHQDSITGIYEDIEISTAGSVFQVSSDIDGTFKNIKIGDITSDSAFKSTAGDVLGTYSNIEIGNVTTDVFCAAFNISINSEDIKIGNVGGNVSRTGSGYVTGTYKNIIIGDVATDCFKAASGLSFSGTFDTIQVGNVGVDLFYSDGNLSGIFKNIKANGVTGSSLFCLGDLTGTFKNISINTAFDFFYGNSIDGTFDNLSLVNGGRYFFAAFTTVTGTFSNMKVDSSTNHVFYANGVLSGHYDNIKVGSTAQRAFSSGPGAPLTGTFKNIKIGSCRSFLTSSSDIQPTLVENIEVGECIEDFIFGTTLDAGIYKNVKVGSVGYRAFYGGYSITGTYYNIEVGSCVIGIFSSGGTINVDVDGAKLTSVGDIFFIDEPGGSVLGKINKLTAYGNDVFPGGLADGNSRVGETFLDAKLTNSTIIKNGSVYAINLNSGSSIERCKVITNTAIGKGIYGNGQVIYTMTNQTIDVTGVVSQNISDASITS